MDWAPSGCKQIPGLKYRITTDDVWYYIECKTVNDEQWQGGISGTQEFLKLTDEECEKAYKRKK